MSYQPLMSHICVSSAKAADVEEPILDYRTFITYNSMLEKGPLHSLVHSWLLGGNNLFLHLNIVDF